MFDVISPNSKLEKKLRGNHLLFAGWLTNLPRFQGARPDHVRVKSSCCCFPRELVSFVRPGEFKVAQQFPAHSKTSILMCHHNHSLSIDATIRVSKNCPITSEHVGIIFVTQQVTIATL